MKPVVRYLDRVGPLEVGGSARVFTRDHIRPDVSGWVFTSLVQKINGNEFETMNTIYKPYKSDLPLGGKTVFTPKEKSIA